MLSRKLSSAKNLHRVMRESSLRQTIVWIFCAFPALAVVIVVVASAFPGFLDFL